jgi:serine/threonine protein kinase
MLGARVAGKYELRRLLGSGSMGAVYEGVHLDIGKRLAIKLIHPEFCESPEVVARFRREARAASAVDSDYIVQIYDFGRDDRLGLYMVIEYLDGEDLEARLARERWIAEEETARLGVQIGRALAKAHAAGIIHRDLKPANVFLTRTPDDDGLAQVKLLDFGISKFDRDSTPASPAQPALTAFGTTLGTPEYMSPEQCKGRDDVDARSDVWAMAAVLYEMLAGEPAVSSEGGYVAVMQRIVDGDIPPLGSRASWVSRRMARVVDAGLTRDRARRIPDAATFVARLLDVYPDVGARSSSGRIALPSRATDISELVPFSDPAASGVQAAAPDAALRALRDPRDPRVRPATAPSPLAETGNSASSTPPSSEPSSSNDDRVAIFERGQLPREIAALRAGRKRQ